MRYRSGYHLRGTPRTDPDGRSLAHPVLIADDWRQSEPRDKDGAVGVQVAIGGPVQAYGSKRSDPFGSGDAVCATTVPAVVLGTPRGCRGFLVPRSSLS